MSDHEPVGEVDARYGFPNAAPTPWAAATAQLERAETYWLSTVRPDGRPHVTPLAGLWLDGALHFTTGPEERKAANLAANRNCVITTGSSAFAGLDVVVEGEAHQVTDEAALQRIADAFIAKYGQMFVFVLRDGTLHHDDGDVIAFRVRARKAFGFRKGDVFSQTRWRF
jgi:hypothetical protein